MSTTRPDFLTLTATLESLILCWLELDRELTRKGGPSSSAGSSEFGAPLDLSVLDAKREIDTFAHTYVRIVMEDTTWTPAALNTPHLLRGLIERIGHFTAAHSDAEIAWEFAQEADDINRRTWNIARPNGRAVIPVGPCVVDTCAGIMGVHIDRDKPMDNASLALWQPDAVCDAERAHVMGAKLYAEMLDTPGHQPLANDTDVVHTGG